jgi:hypothetical protein
MVTHTWAQEAMQRADIIKMQRSAEIKASKRVYFVLNICLTFFFQMTLIIMVFYELIHSPAYAIVIICEVKRPIMFARFICAVILHLA